MLLHLKCFNRYLSRRVTPYNWQRQAVTGGVALRTQYELKRLGNIKEEENQPATIALVSASRANMKIRISNRSSSGKYSGD